MCIDRVNELVEGFGLLVHALAWNGLLVLPSKGHKAMGARHLRMTIRPLVFCFLLTYKIFSLNSRHILVLGYEISLEIGASCQILLRWGGLEFFRIQCRCAVIARCHVLATASIVSLGQP